MAYFGKVREQNANLNILRVNWERLREQVLQYPTDKTIDAIELAIALSTSVAIARQILKDLYSEGQLDCYSDERYRVKPLCPNQSCLSSQESADCVAKESATQDCATSSESPNLLNKTNTDASPASGDITPMSPFTTTCEPSPPIVESSTSSPADLRAKTTQELTPTAKDCKAIAPDFGMNSSESSEKSAQNSFCGKTPQDADTPSPENPCPPWEQFAGTLPRAGMFSNGKLSGQPVLARPTCESASSLLHTPMALTQNSEGYRPPGQDKLEAQLRQWLPTPTAREGTNGATGVKADKRGHCLETEMNLAIPIGEVSHANIRENLMGFEQNWTAIEEDGGSNMELTQSKNSLANNGASHIEGNGSQPLVMPLSPSVPRSLGNTSPISMGETKISWLNPNEVDLRAGTQIRDLSKVTDQIEYSDRIAAWAEKMREGLWDFNRTPLPVVFVDQNCKYWCGDGHTRIAAAVKAGVEIQVDLRDGDKDLAQLHSCRAIENESNGQPLRAKDQRKRIEMFLDLFDKMSDKQKAALLLQVPGRGDRQKDWSPDLMGKFLGLNSAQVRTIQNIVRERKNRELLEKFKEGDRVIVGETLGTITQIDSRRFLLLVEPDNGSLSNWVPMADCEKTDVPAPAKPKLTEAVRLRQEWENAPTSTKQEDAEVARSLGIPPKGLPAKERNEGPAVTDDRAFVAHKEGKPHQFTHGDYIKKLDAEWEPLRQGLVMVLDVGNKYLRCVVPSDYPEETDFLDMEWQGVTIDDSIQHVDPPSIEAPATTDPITPPPKVVEIDLDELAIGVISNLDRFSEAQLIALQSAIAAQLQRGEGVSA